MSVAVSSINMGLPQHQFRRIRHSKMRASLMLFFLAVGLVMAHTPEIVKVEADCKCWEDFKPEKAAGNDFYYCRGLKNHRIFACGEEKPPICKCVVDGKTIELDLGETNCFTVKKNNGRWCENKSEWVEYFKKHPEHAIYD